MRWGKRLVLIGGRKEEGKVVDDEKGEGEDDRKERVRLLMTSEEPCEDGMRWRRRRRRRGVKEKDTGTDRLATYKNEQVSLGLPVRGQQSGHMTDDHDISTDEK